MRSLGILVALFGLTLFCARTAAATEMGLPTAGFHKAAVDLRFGFSGDTTMYRFRDASNDAATYDASFATGGAVVALGLFHKFEINGGAGIAGFNSYSNAFGAPDGRYKFYTVGVRGTFYEMEGAPIQFGGGLQVAWWNHNGLISSGERTAIVGASWRPFQGNVFFAGGEYFTVGSGAAVDAKIGSTPVSLISDGEALYAGYRLRVAIFVLQVEGRVEVPEITRHGLGAMAGIEF